MKMRNITFHSINRMMRAAFAPYEVVDTYATRIFCWTLAEADSWIPYCSPHMIVVDRFWGKIVRERHEMDGSVFIREDDNYAWDSSVFDTIR